MLPNFLSLEVAGHMLNPHDATLQHDAGDSVDLGGSFNTAYRDTDPYVK